MGCYTVMRKERGTLNRMDMFPKVGEVYGWVADQEFWRLAWSLVKEGALYQTDIYNNTKHNNLILYIKYTL